MTKKVKFIVIGCGHIGKRHAAMIAANENAELVALIDIKNKDLLHLEAFDVPFFNAIEELIAANIDFDIATIAVPNGLHSAFSLKLLHLNKDIVVEKPMTLTTKDADELIQLAKKNQRNVFTVMQNRFSPPSVWLKEMVESGRLGKVYLVQLNCFWNRDNRYYVPGSWHGTKELDGGTLFTQFSHFIDIMYWLFGSVSNIQSRLFDFNHQQLTAFEDSGIVSFEFENGGIGSLNYSTAVFDKNLESSITIIAENGSIKVGGQYMDKVDYCHVQNYEMPELAPTLPGNDYGSYKGSAANHHFVIQNIVDVLQKKTTIATTAEEGRAVVNIIENIYKMANVIN